MGPHNSGIVLPKDSYQIHTSNGTVYCCTRQHLHECSVKPADTVPDATNNHATGSCQTLHLNSTACTNQTCTTSATHTCHTHHACNSKATGHSCSCHASCPRGHPHTYACNTQCSPHAAQKIRLCSCSTQVPGTGDVTILQPMRGDPLPRTSPDIIT